MGKVFKVGYYLKKYVYRRTLFVFLGGKIATQSALVMHKYETSHLPYDLKISDMWSIASHLTASVLRGMRLGEGF